MVAMNRNVTHTNVSCICRRRCSTINQWSTRLTESGFFEGISLQGRRKHVFTMIVIETFDTEAAEAL